VLDNLQRPIRDLRISITDRCNFRCTYCMPKEIFGRDYPFLPRAEILTFEEIARLARIFVGLGVTKLRITGGEPLLRRDVDTLVRLLKTQEYPVGQLHEITLTTNGALLGSQTKGAMPAALGGHAATDQNPATGAMPTALGRHAAMATRLVDAGLDRITVSLDSLDDDVFARMNGVDHPVSQVLAGIDAALDAGLPVKVNMVVQRGVNEESILPMARRFHDTGVVLRFIEYMDVGASNGWQMTDVVPADEIVRTIEAELPIEPIDPNYAGEVARRYRYKDGGGEIGLITSVTKPFCGGCTRARISADGRLYTCLFAVDGFDLRSILRSASANSSSTAAGHLASGFIPEDSSLADVIRDIWRARSDRYSELRSQNTSPLLGAGEQPATLLKVEMSRIGG